MCSVDLEAADLITFNCRNPKSSNGNSKSSYNDINKKLYSAYAENAKESMQKAAQEVPNIANPNAEMSDVVDIYISWQKRWQKSLNGLQWNSNPQPLSS